MNQYSRGISPQGDWYNSSASASDDPDDMLSHTASRRQSLFTTSVREYLSADGDSSCRARCKRCGFRVLYHPMFDISIGLVIVVNSVSIGVAQSLALEGKDTAWLESVEHCYLAIYIAELMLRFYVHGAWKSLHDNWIRLDTFFVIVGIASVILTAAFGDVKQLEVPMLLRAVRMLRLARTVRLLVKFRVLFMLVRGLTSSASTMLYTVLLLTMIIYIFSSIGIELVRHHELYEGPNADPEFHEIADRYFKDLVTTMLTLVQFVCLDSIGNIYKPLVEKDMAQGSGLLVVYFTLTILVIGIVLMNLITAVIVNGALEQALQDKDALRVHEDTKKKRLIKGLRPIFRRLDEDSSGEVSLDELLKIGEVDRQQLQQLMPMGDMKEIFNAIDVDESGSLSIDEFCHGISQASVSKIDPDMQRMMRQVNNMHIELKVAGNAVEGLSEVFDEVRCFMREMRAAMATVAPGVVLNGSDMMGSVQKTCPVCSSPESLEKKPMHSSLQATCDLPRGMDQPVVVVWQPQEQRDSARVPKEAPQASAAATEPLQVAEPDASGNLAAGLLASGNTPDRPQGSTPSAADRPPPGDPRQPTTPSSKAEAKPRTRLPRRRPARARKPAGSPGTAAPAAEPAADPGPTSAGVSPGVLRVDTPLPPSHQPPVVHVL